MDTGEQIAELRDDYTEESRTGCHRLVFSPCGKYLAACNSGDKVHVWNVNSGTLVVHSLSICDISSIEVP